MTDNVRIESFDLNVVRSLICL